LRFRRRQGHVADDLHLAGLEIDVVAALEIDAVDL
jgi:hypothetical protein